MKSILIVIFSVMLLQNDPLKISKINKTKREAKSDFNSGNYKGAVEKYKYLIDSLGVDEDEIKLNLANAYYLQNDTANAYTSYQPLIASGNRQIASKANQQLGIIMNKRKKPEEALNFFKQALKSDPLNEDARYNYEMLKKKLEKQNQQNQDKKKDDKDKNKNDNQEPSEFAKKLKAQADLLVSQQRYKEAYDLMSDGLKKDQTVSSYQDYIKRIKDVVEINR